MSMRKRFLLLFGSFLLMAALVFTFNFTHVPAASAAYSETCPPSQSQGSNDTWVQVIKFRLNALRYNGIFNFAQYPLTTNGNFDGNTESAVDAYQHNVMSITDGGGVVGTRTWASLGFCTGFSGQSYSTTYWPFGPTSCPGTLSNGNSSTWVQALQQALNIDATISHNPISKGSWWPLTLDHVFGANTQAAVESLQAANSLSQDGIVGSQTWQKMGMCWFN